MKYTTTFDPPLVALEKGDFETGTPLKKGRWDCCNLHANRETSKKVYEKAQNQWSEREKRVFKGS